MPVDGKTRRDALTEFRHAEILTAANKVFGSKGFNDATLDEIANEAGVAKGTLYLYFPNKEELFLATIRETLQGLLRSSEQQVEAAETTADKVRAAIRARVEFLREHTGLLRIYYTEFGAMCWNSAHMLQTFSDLYTHSVELLEPILRDGIGRGELRPLPPRQAAIALIEMTRGLLTLRVMGIEKGEVDLEQFIFNLFWQGVAVPGKGPA
jgi:AcrR family transcriptional regulator